ncbi:hypothetical protein MFLAVUS_008573 [Mucor flavus]|uniref:Uncharacterized protein n=1 Tax=Mucor flavus TaxID=439312 RepID=A0ABP9Z7N0_9FUNG
MTLVALSYNPPTNSSKWKKGLALLSSKLQHKQRSPTTKAAATEKILRHNSTTTIIKCEDLTAKEFAQMAGIKIKEEDFLTADDEPMYLTTKSTTTYHQMTSISTTLSTKSCHQIWDSDFWQSNQANNNKKTKPNKKTNNNDTLFISQLRSSPPTLNTIQKGRFKIVVGQDDCEPVNQYQHVVLEWKRKRSDSSTTNITK